MVTFEHVDREHVRQALAEYDELGAEEFLERYSYARTRDHVLWHSGRSYDSTAILGVALKYATGTPAESSDFVGGRAGATKVLHALGFEVKSVEETTALESATGSWQQSADVGPEESRAAWTVAAREVLVETARTYRGLVTYKELATEAQIRTGIKTSQLAHYWIGDVLTRVAVDCAGRDEPNLSSLCVNAEGSVGNGYIAAVQAAVGSAPTDDADDHASRERLSCYRHFDAVGLPEGGGSPALTSKLAATRARTRKAAQIARPVVTCPTCYMAIPPTGLCDNCD